uniref:Uncharacterized protein n=1 Tax=Rhizophora mucronata TaxID=61149 RepID=A0A2P2QJS3_RHIMU
MKGEKKGILGFGQELDVHNLILVLQKGCFYDSNL